MGAEGVPLHSSCNVPLPPADGVWRGMGHHSQFRCVEVDDDGALDPWQLDLAALYDRNTATVGAWQFNECRASGTEPGPFPATPNAPIIECTQELAIDGEIGFVAARYREGAYVPRLRG